MGTEYVEPYPQWRELTGAEREALSEACAGMWSKGECPGIVRYCFYRRKGYARGDAFTYALAWGRNMVEQARRRLSHETGAEGWATRLDV